MNSWIAAHRRPSGRSARIEHDKVELVAASIAMVELAMSIESSFGIVVSDEAGQVMRTLDDLVDYVDEARVSSAQAFEVTR